MSDSGFKRAQTRACHFALCSVQTQTPFPYHVCILQADGEGPNISVALGTSECDLDCALPAAPFSPVQFLSPNTTYATINCARPTTLRIETALHMTRTLQVPSEEHGAYSVLVRGAGYAGNDWVVVLTDVPGDASVMPLVVLAVILCVISALHKASPYLLVWCRVRVPDPVYVYPIEGATDSYRSRWAARWLCLRRTFSSCHSFASIWWSFLGFDKHVGALYSGQRAPLSAVVAQAAHMFRCSWRAARAAVPDPSATERLVPELELAEMPRSGQAADLQASDSVIGSDAGAGASNDGGSDGQHLLEDHNLEDHNPLAPSSSSGSGELPTRSSATAAESLPAELRSPSERLRSIDALRGACLCFMMLFNAGGCGYWFLEHRCEAAYVLSVVLADPRPLSL